MFIAFGASASLMGQILYEYQDIIRKVGGILIIIFGLYLLGILKLKFFMTERRLMEFETRPVGYLGSFLIGTAFAAGVDSLCGSCFLVPFWPMRVRLIQWEVGLCSCLLIRWG